MSSNDFDHATTGVLVPIADHVIVEEIESQDERIVNGVIIPSEKGENRGVRSRWARVCAVGPEQEDVKPGEWILVEHGRWTRGVKLDDGLVYRKVDPKGIMLVSETQPEE